MNKFFEGAFAVFTMLRKSSKSSLKFVKFSLIKKLIIWMMEIRFSNFENYLDFDNINFYF